MSLLFINGGMMLWHDSGERTVISHFILRLEGAHGLAQTPPRGRRASRLGSQSDRDPHRVSIDQEWFLVIAVSKGLS